MTALKAFILGLVQGVAEFLPISSSGHLELFKTVLGLEQVPLAFDVLLHISTLLVVLIAFRARIAALFRALWSFVRAPREKSPALEENRAMILPVIIATIVTAVLGFLIESFVDQGGAREVALRMFLTAVILAATLAKVPGTRSPGQIGAARSLFIGAAQGIGVFSGISRSGITISAGIFAGLDRKTAGEFSFILSIPAILGAFILTLKDAGDMFVSVSFLNLGIAFVTAFVSGFLALKFLLKVIERGKLHWFAPYLVVVGILGLLL